MDWLTVTLLLLFGLLFVVAEVIFIPGTTIVGIVGFVLLAVGIWFSYRDLGTPTSHFILGGATVFTGVVVYIGLRPKNLNKFALTDVHDNYVHDARRPDIQPGATGHTISALRPAGTVLFQETRREATTRGEYIAVGTAVRVLRIEQNRIVVEQA